MKKGESKRAEAFARHVVAGKTQVDAYLAVNPAARKRPRSSVKVSASVMAKRAAPVIEAIREAAIDEAVLSRQECLHMLSDTVRAAHEQGREAVFLQAVRTLSQMAGYDAPIQTQTQLTIDYADKTDEELLRIIKGD